MVRDMSNLEDEMRNLEEREARDSSANETSDAVRIEVGVVERFFDKASVAAILLSGDLNVGDTIEFEKDGRIVRQSVESMQIERQDISTAHAGDSVGIKTDLPIEKNSRVYKMLNGNPAL